MYLVCFIDLLGQKEMYKSIEKPPETGEPVPIEFQENVAAFIGSIEFLKENVESYFSGFDNFESTRNWPPELADFRRKMNNHICKVQRFSDGLILYVPLNETDDLMPIGSVYRAFGTAAMATLNCIARGTPVRSGIAIGGATEIGDCELFGPAIAMAHEMESKVSQFPRITVHPDVVDYIVAHAKVENDGTPEAAYKQVIGRSCSGMIARDIDGAHIVHYLGDELWGGMFRETADDVLRKAKSFVEKSLANYQEQGNSKLAIRYLLLNDYLEQHAPINFSA